MILFVAAAVGNPFSRRRDPLHPLLVALQAGVIAFLVHISVDWDWDMAAVGTLVFVFVAVCVSYRATRAGDRAAARGEADQGRPRTTCRPTEARPRARRRSAASASRVERGLRPVSSVGDARPAGRRVAGSRSRRRRRRRSARAVAPPRWAPRTVGCVALLLLAVSWLPPYLCGARRERGPGRLELRQSDRSAEPRPARGLARSSGGQPPADGGDPAAAARAATAKRLRGCRRRRELQPQNYEVWYALGVLLHGSLGTRPGGQSRLHPRPRPQPVRRGEPLRARKARPVVSPASASAAASNPHLGW